MEKESIFKKIGNKAKGFLQKIGILKKEEPKMLEEVSDKIVEDMPKPKERKTNEFKEEIKKTAEVPLIDKFNKPEEYVFAYLKEKGLNRKSKSER